MRTEFCPYAPAIPENEPDLFRVCCTNLWHPITDLIVGSASTTTVARRSETGTEAFTAGEGCLVHINYKSAMFEI